MGQKSSKRVSDASSTIPLATVRRNPSAVDTAGPSSPTTTTPSSPISPTTPITPASNISLPASSTNLRRISELVDPQDLFDIPVADKDFESVAPGTPGPSRIDPSSSATLPLRQSRFLAESPSGNNFLTAEEFMAQGNRALSMRERREMITYNTRVKLESRDEMKAETGSEERSESQGKVRGKRRCWGCWC